LGDFSSLLLTCEHGGNAIPELYAGLFRQAKAVLESHRGHDPGALELAFRLRDELGVPLIESTVSRLLVDLNRSETHPSVFSEFTRDLSEAERELLLEDWHRPHRRRVQHQVGALIPRGRVLHLGVHSFTPVLRGEVRRAEMALLYDPRRPGERSLCERWKALLEGYAPGLRVRRNYPYRGSSDGLTTSLRKLHPDSDYLGVEFEFNHGVLEHPGTWRIVQEALLASLREL
jgi:predicted N-formylglutamate amidohydrolase